MPNYQQEHMHTNTGKYEAQAHMLGKFSGIESSLFSCDQNFQHTDMITHKNMHINTYPHTDSEREDCL